MLSIERCDVEETICVGDLFDQIGFSNDASPTDETGDSYITNNWGIEVLSLDGYYHVEGFRWTKLESQVKLFHVKAKTDEIKSLQCSPEHVVLRQGGNPDWVMVKDLNVGDAIVIKDGVSYVTQIQPVNESERLCDLQVAIAHSYFTDDVLSHNSHFLTFLGANALRNGIDVLHYTFELSESAVGRRYDSNLCDIESNDVIEAKDSIIAQYNTMKLGRLIIKEFPTTTASVYTLRSHIERLDLKGFKPGLIVIDYADIMRSTRQYDSLRHELKLIYEELRGFAGEKQIPIWTASQSNKEGANADVVDLGNMSEAYGKAMVADVVLSLSRKAHEKSGGFGRLFVAKNRAGRDGIVYPVKIDTARSKFEIMGVPGTPEESAVEDEKGFKRALRDKWREVKADAVLSKKGSDDDPKGSNE